MSQKIHYVLEIYEPGTTHDAICILGSDTPFMTISAGDLISVSGRVSASSTLRVTNVEHELVSQKTTAIHKIAIYTEEVNDTADIRLTRR